MKLPTGYSPGDSPDREIVTTRVINAPRDLVFAALSDRDHIGAWWGPNGFTTTTSKMEFRPGGEWRFVMHGADGRDYTNNIFYENIVAPELVVMKHSGEDEDVSHRTILTLEDEGGKTRVTLRGVFDTAAERERVAKKYGAVEGGKQNLERLAAFMEKQNV
jgi:uncharacterized protein YndB with AHSA1/START domain